jgi:hypothetical protein
VLAVQIRQTRGSRHRAHRRILARLRAKQDCADHRRDEAGSGQPVERSPQADLLVQHGKCDGRHRSAERRGHLADPESEAPLLFAEPGHDGATARCVDARTECSDNGERAHKLSVRGRVTGPHQRRSCPRLTECDHGTLTDPVGDDPPRQHRRKRAEVHRGKHDTDLGQAELVAILDRGSDRRQTEQDRGVRPLRQHAGGQDRPAVVT